MYLMFIKQKYHLPNSFIIFNLLLTVMINFEFGRNIGIHIFNAAERTPGEDNTLKMWLHIRRANYGGRISVQSSGEQMSL